MTTAADDRAVEDAFEAYLAGRPVPDEGAALASFAGAVRTTATRPGRPNAALAELLATGLLVDQPSPSPRTARTRNRRRFAMIFPALLAKFLSAGAIAQATAGAGAVVVVVTGAGVVGALPDPVQDTVATAVEAVTPLDLEGGDKAREVVDGDSTGADAGAVSAATATTTAPAEPTAAAFDVELWMDGPVDGESFGSWVSEGAHNKAAIEAADALPGEEGFRFGHLVRSWASAKHVPIEDVEVDGVELEELIGTTPTTAPELAQETTAPAQETGTATTSRGNGKPAGATNGNGGGNGGQGASKGNGRN
jgi:hypothetical protein